MEIELPELLKKLLRPIKRSLALRTSHNSDYRNWYRKNYNKLITYRDRHQGESCFIIGNGPSLSKMDLAPLRNRYTFGLNKIYLMFDKMDLNISYHVTTDPLVIQQSIQPFRELNCPTFICWESGKHYFENCEHVNFIRIQNEPHVPVFSKDITREIWDGGSVSYVAMQLAFYMGFSTIYLIGVDHSYNTRRIPNTTTKEWQAVSYDYSNHFHPNYFDVGQKWDLPDLERAELAYSIAKFAYERSGRKILDATINGRLMIFDKISYEDALIKSTERDPLPPDTRR